MGLGEKNEEKGGKGKKDIREMKPPKNFSPCGRIIFWGEKGGNYMIHLHKIYASGSENALVSSPSLYA